jgi:hypothetical protein
MNAETETPTKKQQAAPPAKQTPPAIEVAVKRVKFAGPTDLPGIDVAAGLNSGGAVNQRRWDIVYLPQMRHFKFTYIDPNKAERQTAYVHESQIRSWWAGD